MKKLLSAMVLGTALLITTVPISQNKLPKSSVSILNDTRPVYPPVIFVD